MVNSKNTKRALLTSALAILACAAMLVGTTFAWFTDTASTAVNKIVSGKLDVELQYAKAWDAETGAPTEWADAEGSLLNFRTADGRTENILWEPGCTYQLPELRLVNHGTLALKYKIVISGIAGDATLNEVIQWNYDQYSLQDGRYEAGRGEELSPTQNSIVGIMLPGENGDVTDPIVISGHMQEDAGNEYQNLSIDGIAVTVYATQYTHEYDSKDNTYDENAEYPTAGDALKTALEKGGNIILGDDIPLSPDVPDKTNRGLVPHMSVSKDTNLDLSGKSLSVDPEAAAEGFGAASPVLIAVMDGTLTIDGDGEINCEAGEEQVYGINVNGGKVVINGGRYYGAITAVQVQKGELEINGGFFDMAPTCKAQVPHYAKYVVNCIDAAYKDGSAKISIKGGTFVNFDPSDNPEGAGTSYVAAGYSVISEAQENGDVWYTVVKGATAKSPAELTEAIRSAEAGDTIYLGTDITTTSALSISKEITFDLKGHTLSSSAANTFKLNAGANVTVTGGVITNTYSGRADPITVDLQGQGAVFTLESGTVQSNTAKDDLYSLAIGNSKKKACTVNILGGTVANPDGQTTSRAISASNGMTVNISGGTISGGLYALDAYAGSVSNISGGKLIANAQDGRSDAYGTSYAIHAKGEAEINIGSADAASTPNVKGIKFESSGVNTELPTINLIKGEITNPIYSMEAKYNYPLFKLGIAADAPVTFTDDTAHFFLADGLQMVQNGSVWKVTAQ